MNISVRTRGMDWNESLQQQVERSIAFAVDRHEGRVEQVTVYLADLNGPRGGVDKLCQITAELKGCLPVMILETGEDVAGAVNRASRRLGYRIGRRIARSREVRMPMSRAAA